MRESLPALALAVLAAAQVAPLHLILLTLMVGTAVGLALGRSRSLAYAVLAVGSIIIVFNEPLSRLVSSLRSTLI